MISPLFDRKLLPSRMMARSCAEDLADVNLKPPQTGTPIVNTRDETAVQAACDVLCRGGVVALPTDTIYGQL